MTASTLLRLGRVSNLPTVWSNVLAGVALAGAGASRMALVATAIAISLLYVAGMALNDYFDRDADTRERPERPIPMREITPRAVLLLGVGLMAAALFILAALAWQSGSAWGVASGAGLCVAIVVYDAWHQRSPLAPLVMGLCRMLVYVTAALAVSDHAPARVWWFGGLLAAYVVGITFTARGEHVGRLPHAGSLAILAAPLAYGGWAIATSAEPTRAVAWLVPAGLWLVLVAWVSGAVVTARAGGRSVPRGVVALIAGIALWDAWLAAAHGRFVFAAAAVGFFALTRILQRWVPGT